MNTNSLSVTPSEQAKIFSRCEGVNLKCASAFQQRLTDVKERALAGQIDPLQFEREVEDILASDRELHEIRASRVQTGTFSAQHPGRNPIDDRILTAAFCLAGGLSHPEKHFQEPLLDRADSIIRSVGLQSLLMRAACENGYQAGPAESITQGNLRRVLQAAFAPDLKASGCSRRRLCCRTPASGSKLQANRAHYQTVTASSCT
jgi:hypothetical protein